MTVSLVQRYRELPAAPWANGAGATTTLVSWSESEAIAAGRARWRLSVASLVRPAPFSPLPGIDRSFLPVGGDVVLRIDGIERTVVSGEIVRFAGDSVVELLALTSECFAVNLMVERSGGRAVELSVVERIDPVQALRAVVLAPADGFERFDLVRANSSGPDAVLRAAAVG